MPPPLIDAKIFHIYFHDTPYYRYVATICHAGCCPPAVADMNDAADITLKMPLRRNAIADFLRHAYYAACCLISRQIIFAAAIIRCRQY